MLKPSIRWASPNEGPQIEAMAVKEGLCPAGINWSHVEGWMVAVHGEAVIGAIQVLPGKPLGHIGFVVIDEQHQNSGAGYWLWKAAERWLGHQGIDAYTGITNTPVVLKAITKSGGIVFGEPVNYLFKRVVQRNK